MVGITSYGGYIPWYRINRMTIYGAIGSWLNPASLLPGEKAVANWDEDSVSMAVNAAIDCLTDAEREKIDGLYFATTTSPFIRSASRSASPQPSCLPSTGIPVTASSSPPPG